MKTTIFAPLFACFLVVPSLARPTLQELPNVPGPAANDESSIFGEPLYVGAKRITDMEIKRFLCYGKGRNALEARKLGTLMQQEWELRVFETRNLLLDEQFDGRALEDLGDAEQADLQRQVDEILSRFEFDVEEYEDRLMREEKQFYERFPTLNLETEIARAYQSTQWYKDQVRQTLQFDDLFFKGHPDDWPAITIEATHQGSPEFDLVDDYARNHVLRLDLWHEKRATTETELLTVHFGGVAKDALTAPDAKRLKEMVDEEHGRFEPREDEMMMGLLRDFVMEALNNLVEVKTSIHGLPPHILMTVEGGGFEAELLLTEDVYQEMRHAFNDHDIEEAKTFLALTEATRQKLIAQGAYLGDDEFRAQFDDLSGQMENTMFQMDFLALQGHQFPSVESFYNHLRLLESYKTTIQDSLALDANGQPTPAMQAHMPIANGIMGLAKCQVEVLLVSAFDHPNNRWKENGWAAAEAGALELRKQIDTYLDRLAQQEQERHLAASEGRNAEIDESLKPFDQWWSELLDLNSEYWDPPLPVSGKMPAAVGMKNRGRFQGVAMTRNDMKRALGESSYTHYLDDFALVDEIFFNVEPGTVAGPFLGPQGFYICYLKAKNAPTNPLRLNNEKHLGMVQEDFARVSFTEFSHACLEQAEVRGL